MTNPTLTFTLEELTLLRHNAYQQYACSTQLLGHRNEATMLLSLAVYEKLNDAHKTMAHADAEWWTPPTMTTKPTPTTEQLEALEAYAAKNGRTWKQALMNDWMHGRTQGPLQQVRNTFGPSWLKRFQPLTSPTAPLPSPVKPIDERRAAAAQRATAAFEVRTDYYEFAHGKRPSGRGYWAFEFREAGGWSEPFFVSGSKLYSEAKREAQAEGMRRGAHYARAAS